LENDSFSQVPKMKRETIIAIIVIAYLAIALPLLVFNNSAMQACSNACVEQGFDKALEARGFGPIECRCFEKHTGEEKVITIT